MLARAALGVALDRHGRTRITTLHSDPPLVLRPTLLCPRTPPGLCDPARTAFVSLATGAGGPVGGDDLELRVHVGAGATLLLTAVAASVVLPGPHGGPSRTTLLAEVDTGATLLWLPEPLVAAAWCRHRATTKIELAADARLLAREETILGRHNEAPGSIHQRLRVSRSGTALYDQEFTAGPDSDGWAGAAVTGGHKALGSLIMIAPGAAAPHPRDPCFPGTEQLAVLQLATSGAVASALAHDSLTLRQRLDRGLNLLRDTYPWGTGAIPAHHSPDSTSGPTSAASHPAARA